MESNFICNSLARDGDYNFSDRAVETYKAFQTCLPATVGYAGIDDVRQTNSTTGADDCGDCESFWFAEVSK